MLATLDKPDTILRAEDILGEHFGALALTGLGACSAESAPASDDAASEVSTTVQDTAASTTQASFSSPAVEGAVNLVDVASLFSARDLDASYDESSATKIELTGSGATVSGSGAEASGSTITITAEGVYVVEGELSDGQIVADAADTDKVRIVLKGASISTGSASAIYVANADKVFLTLTEGTTNTLAASGASYQDDSSTVDSTVFSHDDITVNGSGSLTVTSSQGNGIVGKDEVTLTGGDVSVEAAGHAIQANNSIAIADGSYELVGGTDALHASHDTDATLGFIYVGGGELELSAGSDAMDASSFVQVDGGKIAVAAADDALHAEYDLAINGGTIDVATCTEGVEGSSISITGGETTVVSSDDGLNAAGDPNGNYGDFETDPSAKLSISGGKLVVDAQGDGIDSNGDLLVSGGETYVSGPSNSGNGSMDYVGEGTITGGIFVCAGAAGMDQNFGSNSTQGTILVTVGGSASGTVSLSDSSGNVLASFEPTRQYQSVLVSAPGVSDSGTYTLSCGGSETSIEMNGYVYGAGGGMMGGMGGGPGGMSGGMAPGGDMTGGPGGMAPGGPGGMGGAMVPGGEAQAISAT